jgi:hypothetical protein
MSYVDPPPREQWAAEPLKLPDSATIFNQLRSSAEQIFDVRDMDAWLEREIEPDVLEVGEMRVARAVVQKEQAKLLDDNERYERWDDEVREKIESAREEVTHYFESMADRTKEVDWRLREEELAARERLVYEYQAKEAELLGRLNRRKGMLQQVPSDKFSWTIEWKRAPQEFELNVTCLRGIRNKLRDGYYVVLVSLLDLVGGQTLRFSTGDCNIDCSAALPPMRYVAKANEPDRFINRSMNLLCPARAVLQTHVCLLIELWQLKVGKFDPNDKVVGWGIWPLVNKDFMVVEGKFKVPLIKGPYDKSIDTYRSITRNLQYNLEYWLCNVYFEIKLDRKDHHRLTSPSVKVQIGGDNNMTGDALRLEKTVDDFRGLIVAKLPPRLFFDDVSNSTTAASGLRRRFFGNQDRRMLNSALWEKRAMLEEERTALLSELAVRKTRAMTTDEDHDIKDFKLRKEIDATGVTRQSRFPDVEFAEDEDPGKARDSHILLLNHHSGIMSQRDFFFLGRRYRDRLAVSSAVLEYDMGINRSGPWDKMRIVVSIIFMLLGLLFRAYIHGLGLYLYLQFLNVPLTANEWGVMYVDIRFDFTSRFYPNDTLVATFVGTAACILFFNIFFLFIYGLLAVFDSFPYAVTRFLFWFGVAAVGDPIFEAITDFALGNLETGDTFLLVNMMVREEGSAISGLLLSIAAFACLSIIQVAALYGFICYVHLNGRVDDVYNRIMSPESCFFIPHDLEVSQEELRTSVKLAKAYRNDSGSIKMVRVYEMNHFQTCYFRARLFTLLNILTNEPDEWVGQYIDHIPLRRPRYVEDLIEKNLGTYALGSDIMSFMRRNFPHLTVMSQRRIGDDDEDMYYEQDLIRDTQHRATPKEDDAEMRTLLKAYFQAQVFLGKPAEWKTGSSRGFVINDAQLLADCIFFETSFPNLRLLYLSLFLRASAADASFAAGAAAFITGGAGGAGGFDRLLSTNPEDPKTFIDAELPNFDRTEPVTSLNGKPVCGSIIHIVLENPVKGVKQLSRTFVVTPYGMILEPKSKSFSLLQAHTSDDPEFWAHKAIQLDTETERNYASFKRD